MNGYLTKTVHSTHNVQTQVVNAAIETSPLVLTKCRMFFQVVAAWKMAFCSSDNGTSESYGIDRFRFGGN